MSHRNSLRSIVESVQPEHAGLWFDRYFTALSADDNDAKRNHVTKTADICPNGPAHYAHAFSLWRASLEELEATCREAQVATRMVVGLGAESFIETSITLHRTYGVPYIPGSALKGLAARWARTQLADPAWEKKNSGEAYKILFGDTESAGYVTFFDALFVPGSGFERRALWPDVITVHHGEYYSSGKSAPTDWDSPNPVPFLTATGKYLLALSGPEEWVKVAFDILEKALQAEGVGGKTTRGYGRMKLSPVAAASAVKPGTSAVIVRNDAIDRITQMKANDVPNNIGQFVTRWRALKDKPDEARTLGLAIVDKVEKLWKNGMTKDWYKEIKASLAEGPPS